MVRTNRRTTMLGMGALAMGSGAVFTSATFEDSVTPDADFRVLVDERLVALPGPGFRDGGVTGGEYVSDITGKYLGEDHSLFDDETTPPLGRPGVFDLPKAQVNDAENANLEVNVGMLNDQTEQWRGLLQVQNRSDQSIAVGMTISQFGEDVTATDNTDRGVHAKDVYESLYFFEMDDPTSGDPASDPTNANFESIWPTSVTDGDMSHFEDQTPDNHVNVQAGETHVISLSSDTETESSQIAGVADRSPAFTTIAFDDLKLIEELRIGVEDTE